MAKRKVLFIVHNHPKTRPGGAEAYAYETYLAMRESDEFEPYFVAKAGPPLEPIGRVHSGTPFAPADAADPNQYFVYTDGYRFDWLMGTTTDKELFTKHFRGFLKAIQPDVVHFQHTLFLGYDLIREVRTTLPDAAILYTLHEFLPICHRQGQMVRTMNNQPCDEESPRRCHECFPEISPQSFFLRKRLTMSHFDLVDLFIAPSQFLLERYVEWGIPRERIVFEDYGRLPLASPPGEPPDRPRDRFGFFGQFNPYKGADVALEAMARIGSEVENDRDGSSAVPRPHLWLHGANLDLQEGAFQTRLRDLVEAAGDTVTLVGRYDHRDLPALMENIDWVIVPSIWWENSPLVIQEAFMYGKPVICSDIGGMAEKVTDGVDGLHFRSGDPMALARTIRRAASDPDLWSELRSNIKPVYAMSDHLAVLYRWYEAVSARRGAEAEAIA
jgi:glycosyltransferase involved in cell wall biosynthesis